MAASTQPVNKLQEQATSKGDLSYSGWASSTSTSIAPAAKKLSAAEAEHANALHKSASGSGSLWNAAQTFEERDLTKWAKDAISSYLCEVKCEANGGEVKMQVTGVESSEGDASVCVVRGKKRAGFDFKLKLKWSAQVKRADEEEAVEVTGSLRVPNFAADELGDLEMEDVKLQGKDEEGSRAGRSAAREAVRKHMLPHIEKACEKFYKALQEK
mmetsp:Transcript_43963/g.78527  ORF Transcript_43963/g.78527 Transcript_43963/m.78527 type:complete len:214 (-) Transcript_43963:292-933(-)|eukprot:CAMPEP_0177768388 /NCGR_PEP_ID=MMETSP0491_2-20121128/9693_1 /TAXON_ID=63592 /ORGANISM="Tetraselmis chuii, Strain PLY429" /LENGTH=213 /DNA_ID=CAMNT_0019285189 /DNA_START=230 /DNA_END=871 /DNA_ORIENTATION=+